MPSANAGSQQRAAILSQTRLMQPNAWSGPGQPSRAQASFSFYRTYAGPIGTTRLVRYQAGPNAFGGTMAMFLSGQGRTFEQRAWPLNASVLEIPVGDDQPRTLPVGRGYSTSEMRTATNARLFAGFTQAPDCTAWFPPAPVGCELFGSLMSELTPPSPFVGEVIGFPWTTGHVSVHKAGLTALGIPFTTTLTARGSDQLVGGVRTIQLVAGGVSYRERPGVVPRVMRDAYLDIVTIRVPEPGMTVALTLCLALLGMLRAVMIRD